MKWVYLATAPDQLTAEIWRELLWQERISAEIRASDAVSFLGVSPYPCRLMVPEEEQQRAKEILGTYLETPVE
ncbi:MAG: DUF2007 domain-containing protein [Chloroflexi bacterium]|nr:DUF2007 domain-containing protein [Chloroflexota bacterium]